MKQEEIKFIDVRIGIENDCYGDVMVVTKNGRILGRRFEGFPLEKIGVMVDRLIKNFVEDEI